MLSDERTLVRALDPLRDMLAVDGYEMRCTFVGPVVTVHVDATPSACADCLAPADTIEYIIIDRLQEAGVEVSDLIVNVVLPSGSA